MSSDYQPTYWYHPESDCFFICYDKLEEDKAGEEGLCVQLDNEFQYCTRMIQRIDEDPTHTLPQDVVGIIKLAKYEHKSKSVNGAIYYDQRKRFVDGYMINAQGVERQPGGLITTQAGDKYICEFVQG